MLHFELPCLIHLLNFWNPVFKENITALYMQAFFPYRNPMDEW